MKQIGSCKIYYFGGKTMSLNDLVLEFRQAIDKAKSLGALEKDCIFCRFPRGCCGDTSDLLAHYLLEHGIKTNYICGNYRNGGIEKWQSHAWLETIDGTVIDITGDQFKYDDDFLRYDKAVYIGPKDDFHKLFSVEARDIRESVRIESLGCLDPKRLFDIYNLLIKIIYCQ